MEIKMTFLLHLPKAIPAYATAAIAGIIASISHDMLTYWVFNVTGIAIFVGTTVWMLWKCDCERSDYSEQEKKQEV